MCKCVHRYIQSNIIQRCFLLRNDRFDSGCSDVNACVSVCDFFFNLTDLLLPVAISFEFMIWNGANHLFIQMINLTTNAAMRDVCFFIIIYGYLHVCWFFSSVAVIVPILQSNQCLHVCASITNGFTFSFIKSVHWLDKKNYWNGCITQIVCAASKWYFNQFSCGSDDKIDYFYPIKSRLKMKNSKWKSFSI